MTFPSIAASNHTNGTSAGTSVTVNLPTITANDNGKLLISVHRAAAGGTISWPSGWTEVFENTADASDDSTAWAWKKCNGNEGSTMTVTQGTSGKFANLCWLIDLAPDPAVRPPESGTVNTGTSSNPDPGSVTPSGGAKDYLFLAIEGNDNEPAVGPGYPTNYTLNQEEASSGTGGATATNCCLAGAGRQVNTATEDPGTFSRSISVNWTAFTIAVHPAPPMYADDDAFIPRICEIPENIMVYN